MKTVQHLREFASRIVIAAPQSITAPFFASLNATIGVARLTHLSEHQIPFAWEQLEAFARVNCPEVLKKSLLEEREDEIAFLRASWRLRMDEDAPRFFPQ